MYFVSQLTQEQLGNGIIVNRSFDAVTGWIDYIRCGIGRCVIVWKLQRLSSCVSN